MRDHVKAKAVRARRNVRYRERKRKRLTCVLVEADEAILDFLQRFRWLGEADVHDAAKVAAAIKACLSTSAAKI
jgi:hypothetical protein